MTGLVFCMCPLGDIKDVPVSCGKKSELLLLDLYLLFSSLPYW